MQTESRTSMWPLPPPHNSGEGLEFCFWEVNLLEYTNSLTTLDEEIGMETR